MRRAVLLGGAAVLAAGPALPAALDLAIELPQLDVPRYHRPYLAAWVETGAGDPAATLAVWYDTRLRDDLGEGWLKELRQWWRAEGEALDLPADAISGATRAPGTHDLRFGAEGGPLADLPPGPYVLKVEAAREKGGREVLSLPFDWPVPGEAQGTGQTELGAVRLTVSR